jgi:hypothetical protein
VPVVDQNGRCRLAGAEKRAGILQILVVGGWLLVIGFSIHFKDYGFVVLDIPTCFLVKEARIS